MPMLRSTCSGPKATTGGMLMDAPSEEFALAGSLEELKIKGRLVVHGGHRPILVIYDRGRVFALDNRCPHMGFPLERGSVEDGILTCHWHHARFDLESGCTFDLWADDVPICPVEVRNGDVWVKTTFTHADLAAHWHQRLANGLAHDLGLVIAKAMHGQLAAGVPQAEIVREVALFGAQNRVGWQHAAALLPTVVGQMVAARGAEESTAWRQPVDLVALCEESTSELADLFAAGRSSRDWSGHAALSQELLGDDPARIVDELKEAIRAGAAPADLGQSLAYAAALRVARFGNANIDTHVTAVRGVLHGAMALYLARYLNVPPARIPGDAGEQLDDLPADPETIGAALLDAFDRQRQVDLAASLVARHLTLGHSPQALIGTLAHAVLREDAGFHAYQMLEAGVRQFGAWGDTDEGRHILVAVARYLAAHSPTERASLQTADIARRLMRGGELHQEAGSS